MAQDMHDWLAGFAAEIGVTPPGQEELEMLLELAGVAAHASERAAAPLTCWLAARAGIDAAEALAVGKRLAGRDKAGDGRDGPLTQQAGDGRDGPLTQRARVTLRGGTGPRLLRGPGPARKPQRADRDRGANGINWSPSPSATRQVASGI